jgi:GAF domain-containing protein
VSDPFADIAADLHAVRHSPERTVEKIVSWACKAVQSDEAGVMFVHKRGVFETLAPSSAEVAQAHELQIELDEGPCLEVLKDGAPNSFLIGETGSDSRFPRWGPAAAELGFRSVISVLLATKERNLGSLNMYGRTVRLFDRDDLATIEIFARHASIALAHSRERQGQDLALDSRKLIGQAQGILMERFDIDADRAFDYLVRQSQQQNVKLRQIAAWIVDHRAENPSSPDD